MDNGLGLPPAVWALPLPAKVDLGAELGSLEAIEAALADLDPSESSLGSWANECERADATLAAAEAQLGRTGDGPEMDAALAAAEARMEKEDRELLVVLEAAMAPLHPHQPEPEDRPLAKGKVGRQKHPPPPPNGSCRRTGGKINPPKPETFFASEFDDLCKCSSYVSL